MRTAPLRVAGVAVWFLLWVCATVWADTIGDLIRPGQLTTDTVGAAFVLLIALVVRWETAGWFGFLLTLLLGPVYSLRSFWRLPARVRPAGAGRP
jgi:hypothetical protein